VEEEIVIHFEGVHKRFGKQHVLRGVTLDIRRSESMVIIGRSGCGKSVLLKHLIGLLKPSAGRIVVEGRDVAVLPESQMVDIRKKIGIVFQGGALFDSLTVEANVGFPLKEERVHSAADIKERVTEVLEAVGLHNQHNKMPSELSGGMRKRVALARAIIRKPEVIVYDEPTTGLDPVMTDSINKLINRMRERYGVTSIVVTHDMKTVFACADRVAMLHEGVVYSVGTPGELKENSDVLVQNFIGGISTDEDTDF